MSNLPRILARLVLGASLVLAPDILMAQTRQIPDVLQPWRDWVTWEDKHRECPTPDSAPDQHICYWPSQMTLSVDRRQGSWRIEVNVYAETWVLLPGNGDAWPIGVRANGEPVAVVERGGTPAVQLPRGAHEITGDFTWDVMPQRIAIPKLIGLLSLVRDGDEVAFPNWDTNGDVWLRRSRTEGTQKDSLTAQVYRVVEDGIPLWLRTEIELTVSGKSREEELGSVLPEGWILSSVESPIPVAVDDQGRMRAQVRAGKWTIQLHSFQTSNLEVVQFANDADPISANELVALRADPEFRLAEFQDISAIDVTQTTFPDEWRDLPVFLWQTTTPFRFVEKIRGMGGQQPEGLTVRRQLWLDEEGQGFTYLDHVSGRIQTISRLDAAEGQVLGAVRIAGTGQLITANPETGAHGVEIRSRHLNLEAIGRMGRSLNLPATGWQTDVDSLQLTLQLPPGWRVLALFGADHVDGDWLTAWTLLDLFLLLIFSLAVCRLWGLWAGLIAFLAFGMAYHEIGAPRITWLFVLMPVALLRVVPPGTAHRLISAWKLIATGLLVFCLIPFLARQIQNAIYPQLERPGVTYSARGMFRSLDLGLDTRARVAASAGVQESGAKRLEAGNMLDLYQADNASAQPSQQRVANLMQDAKARIQTGPGDPQWSWNAVHCRWNGPVAADQTIRPVIFSLPVHRILTGVRVVLLLVLVAIVLGARRVANQLSKRTAAAGVAILALALPNSVHAQLPDPVMLDALRERLNEPSDAFPHAADIPHVALELADDKLIMRAEIHAAMEVAVPLPGRLPTWSPLTIRIDSEPAPSVCRREGFLWIIVPAGVHQVDVQGLLPKADEWDWTFQLKPRRVSINAAGWNVTGVRPNGIPEQQIFFARQREAASREAAYDRKDFQTILAVSRHLEIGLVWQLRTSVTRLSTTGKAVSLRIPLLPEERVITSNMVTDKGRIEVSLSAGQKSFTWESELPTGGDIRLSAEPTDQWVERWYLVTSPVWNTSLTGLMPVFESQQPDLIPVWHPWPGEEATLHFTKPVAISGDTLTVRQVLQETALGSRQSTHQLKLQLECSLGDDLVLDLDAGAQISSLQRDGQTIPVRRDGGRLFVPVRPGAQVVDVAWRTANRLRSVARTSRVGFPLEASNITTTMRVPQSRWVLWAQGPVWGPAVRFWIILPCAILAAIILGSFALSPLNRLEWVLLAVGLTQVQLMPALTVVGWLFLLAWRGQQQPNPTRRWRFNILQLLLVLLTLIVLCILIAVVGEGLLGRPEMFIIGNGSTQTHLKWFQAIADGELPRPSIVSVSVWYYRLLMLLWALWLATALLRWLTWGWHQFSHGGIWQRRAPKVAVSTG